MTTGAENRVGRVCLVGAGPGDPGLITARGLELLRRADVVVFDALANPVLLDQAPAHAQRIDCGKRARQHKLTQDQTNELLVQKAREGGLVVRLKGGDPYLFGRGAEEAAYLARHGVECEVIPGVTAGIAAPAAAGIPVTHREIASTLTFVTGHEDPTKDATAIDYASLAGLIKAGGTACFYMGVGRLGAISAALTAHGLGGDTPCALVQWGTLPKQRSLRTTLAKAEADVKAAGIGPPAIIVVGQVAGIDEPGLDGFERRPLFGRRILVTRTRQQASELRAKLEELGAWVFEAPTIQIIPPADAAAVDRTLAGLSGYDWLVFTSGNAVEAAAARLEALGLDARALAGVKIACVGDATEAALRQHMGVRPDFVPTRFVAESLAGELIARQSVAGKKFLLLRADIARPNLPKLLREAGATVDDVAVYETKLADGLPEEIRTALRDGQIEWVTFTSASTANNLAELLGADRGLLEKARIASIGPITSQAVRGLGLTVDVEASEANIDGLVAALVGAAEHPR